MSFRQQLPYRRKAGRPEFAEAKELDTAALQRMWLPYITFSCAETTHVIVKNAYVTWQHVARLPRDDLLARPWTAVIPAPGLRPWVLGQARAADHLGGEDGDASTPMAELREVWEKWLYGPDMLRRLQMTSLLASMTCTVPITETVDPGPDVTDPVSQHFRLMRAAVLHVRYPTDRHNVEIMEHHAHHACEPVLRTVATVQVIQHALRVERDWDTAARWLDHGYTTLDALAEHPPWLAHLVESRFHRVAALYHYQRKEAERTAPALELAVAADARLRAVAGDHPILTHLWLENRRTLLESMVKNQFGRDPAAVGEQVSELDRIEPHFAESRFFIGELYARAGQLDKAAAHFRSAAVGGGGRAPAGAFRAFQCYRELGDSDAAARCLQLTYELDPLIELDHHLSRAAR
jgi:hypothetical protein